MARILLLITAPAWRGSGVSFAKISTGLLAAGHQVTAVCAARDVAEGLSRAGLLDVQLLDLPDSGFRASRRLALMNRTSRWQVTIADAPRDARLASAAGVTPIAWRFNLPNRPVPADLLSRWRFRGIRRMIYQSHFVESLVKSGAPWLAAKGGVTILNGYDIDLLRPDRERGLAWRAAHGIPADALLLVTVGALSPEKALPVTLAAGSAMAQEFPGLFQLFIGSGEDGERLVREAGPHVLFFGTLDAANTHDAMRAADVMLQLSPRETFSNVVAEAMALGCAVVGSSSGGINEVVDEAGVRVGSDHLEQINAGLRGLLSSPEMRAQYGRAAHNRIASTYSLARMQQGYATLIDQLVHP